LSIIPFQLNQARDKRAGLSSQSDSLLANSHYRKGDSIASLFVSDQPALLPLPRQQFNASSYDSLQTDGYGKICLDGKHYTYASEIADDVFRISDDDVSDFLVMIFWIFA
jgi:hypothetical protein